MRYAPNDDIAHTKENVSKINAMYTRYTGRFLRCVLAACDAASIRTSSAAEVAAEIEFEEFIVLMGLEPPQPQVELYWE